MKRRRRKFRNRIKQQNQPTFEQLQPRQLLAGITFDAATGVVFVEGTNHVDAVQITTESTTEIRVRHGGNSQVFETELVNEIEFHGRNGNDWFRNDTDVPSRAYGQGGDDILVGGNDRDRLRGGSGDDRLTGRDGHDFIAGDSGNNVMIGGAGNDRIEGLYGDDLIWGESGDDVIIAGAGDDYVHGGNGDDEIHGYAGDDRINGGDGDDFIAGDAGSDWIYGANGDDTLHGNLGRDEVFGGSGNDDIFGGDNDDDLFGHQGDDHLLGGQGNDDLYGGAHTDLMFGGDGNDDYYEDRFDNVIDDSSDYSANGDFELRGPVADLNSTAQTFSLLGITVNYANAEFVTNIQNGTFVKAEGAYDGSVLQAREVELEFDNNRDDNFEARGVVTNLDSVAETFTLFGFTVDYSAARRDGQPVEGAQIQVEGRLTGSQVAATEIEVAGSTGDPGGGDDGTNDNGVNGDLEVRGVITNFNSSARTFSVLGLAVNFSSAQLQGQLGNGTFVKVEGGYNGTLINAREVEVEAPDNRDENFEARGMIENLNTNSQTFDFLGFTVNYDNARVTTPLVDGNSIELEGWFANGTITAEEIQA